MSPFPNVGYLAGVDGKIIPLPPLLIQRAGVAQATDIQSTTSTTLVDMPDLAVALSLEVASTVLLQACLYVYSATAGAVAYYQFADAANNPLGVLWHVTLTAAADRYLVPLLALASGTVGNNTFKVRWYSGGSYSVSVKERALVAVAWPG
jgi:hypothetical protein